MSSDKQKHVVVISQPKKRGYVSWNSQMDAILISVFYDQVSQGNKGDGDWKPQAYQAVVDELKNKLSMSLTTDHVRNRVKIWKKHYGIITEIRTKTKFTWDNEKKMVVIGIEDMADWMKYTQSFPSAAPYSNKCVENWDDICVLVGPDRAIGDGGEHYEEGVNMMDEEAGEARSSSLDTTSCSSRKKQKSDRLADAVSSFANSFQGYVETRKKESSILSGKEVRDVVTKVYGILPHQVLRAVLLLMESPQKFQMLKDLPEDEKLDWILLCLNASNN